MIKIKRAYDKPSRTDGFRVLVDRLWPRGKKKEDLALNEWDRELAPSDELRKSFGHDPSKWADFQKQYLVELRARPEAKEKLRQLATLSHKKSVTLVYGAHDEKHNQAVVLKHVLEQIH